MKRDYYQQDDDDFDDEDELPDGVYYDDEEPEIDCPYCGASILEDTPYCPRCERYLSREDAPRSSKPLWIWVCLIAALAGMIWATV